MKINNTLILFLIVIIYLVSNSSCQISQQSGSDPIEYLSCPNHCNYNGYCRYGEDICVCYEGWTGDQCELRDYFSNPSQTPSGSTYFSCPNNCNYNGVCNMGVCECQSGYSGNECQYSNDQKVVCEHTSNGISVRSDFKEVICTIKGNGFCIDSLTQLKCKSKGYYSEVECTILMSFGRYTHVHCEGNHVECVSEYAVCSINNGEFQINNQLQREKIVDITPNSNSIASSSNSLFFFITTLAFIVIL